MIYLWWYDDNKSASAADKARAALAAYVLRFAVQPNVLLVNSGDAVTIPGVDVRVKPYIRPNNFQAGREEA